jgi:hypothetical protein
MRRLTALLLSCSAIALAACGGDDGDDSPEPNRVREDEWAAQVNEICRDNRDRSLAIAAEVRNEGLTGNQAAAEVLERAQPLQDELIEDVAEVPAPPELQEDFDRFVDRIRDTLPLFERLAEATREGREDPELNTALIEVAADTRPFATEHGLTDCLTDAG